MALTFDIFIPFCSSTVWRPFYLQYENAIRSFTLLSEYDIAIYLGLKDRSFRLSRLFINAQAHYPWAIIFAFWLAFSRLWSEEFGLS